MTFSAALSIFRTMRMTATCLSKRKIRIAFAGVIALFILLAFANFLLTDAKNSAMHDQPLPGMTVEQSGGRPNILFVTSVKSNSEAEQAGLKAGTKIVAINGQMVSPTADSFHILNSDDKGMVNLKIDDHHQIRAITLHR